MSAAASAPVTPPPAAPRPGASADFGTRFSAFVIDALLLFSGQWIMFIVLSRQLQAVGLTTTEPCVAGGAALCEGPSTVLWVLLLSLYVVTTIGYHAVSEGLYGATPGKRLLGLRVTGADGQSPIGMAGGMLRSVVRQLFWLTPLFLFDVSPLSLGLPSVLFALVPALTLIVFLLGAFRTDGRAGHDLAARTMVVRNDEKVAAIDKPTAMKPTSALVSSTAASSVQPPLSPPSDEIVAAEEPEDSA